MDQIAMVLDTHGVDDSGGGLVAIDLKSNIPVAPILAVNIGASAPLILATLVAQVPAIPPGKAD
jgi:hypothetical protein